MDESFLKSIGINSSDFAVEYEFILRENLRQAEEKCCENVDQPDKAELLKRKLWIHLVRLSLELENLQLAELLIAKLKLVQLALLVRSTLQQANKINELAALHYIARYFNIEHNLKIKIETLLSDFSNNNNGSSSTVNITHEYDQLVDIYVDSGEWESAFNLIEGIPANNRIKDIKKSLIAHKFAIHSEIDENFEQALINYEQSGGELGNCTRVIVKQYMNTAFRELKKYCLKNARLSNFWSQYHLLALGAEIRLENISELNGDGDRNTVTSWMCGRLNASKKKLISDDTIFTSIPDEIRNFVTDLNSYKWFKRRKIESIISSTSCLSSISRSRLAELSRRYDQNNLFLEASGLYICIDQVELFLNTSSKFLSKLDCLQLACQFKSTETILTNMIEYLIRGKEACQRKKVKKKHSKGDSIKEYEVLSKACIKLGLIDEALQIFSFSGSSNDQIIVDATEHLETLIKLKHRGSLDSVDPELSNLSLKMIHDSLLGNQISATNVITTVILCITILLYKLDSTSDVGGSNLFSTKLEVMFENLSQFFDELTFNASESLVNSTNTLITAIKDKLDVLPDSVIIKEGFRKVVETTASRCMIESQYKKAAMLYRHIEDNVNAVKSLMRIGDVDIVINFSLLVRDITVNKLTINYLKHLNVEPKVIEDFMARSKAI